MKWSRYLFGPPSVRIQTEVNCKGNSLRTRILYLLIPLTGKTSLLGLCISKIHIHLVLHFLLVFYSDYIYSLCHLAVKPYFFKLSTKISTKQHCDVLHLAKIRFFHIEICTF